jgi:Kef-type K+ transport system membrane component KefB
VIDDVLGLVILTLVTGSASAAGALGHVFFLRLAATIAKTAGFFAVALFVGSRTAPRLFASVAKLRASGAQVAIGLALCFAHAWIADAIGLAPIVGAFTAGLVVEEAHSEHFVARGERPLRELVEPVSSFLVPVFFVLMGARVDLGTLASGPALGVAAALTIAAVVGKSACALGAAGVRRLPVAIGMIPRGEVTLIYASIGGTVLVEGRPLLDPPLYSALVFVVIASTLLTPAALKWVFQRNAAALTPSEASSAP